MRQVSSFQFPVSNPVPRGPRSSISVHRSAFSLIEVLLAIFILGIGMIMVASVFPVGANWTRQTAEESVAQTVAQDALSVIRRHYGDGGDLRSYLAPDFLDGLGAANPNNRNTILKAGPPVAPLFMSPFTLQALPGFVSDPPASPTSPGIPPAERAYQFGSANPFPAANWGNCTYYWTALARLSPAHRAPPPSAIGDGTNGIILSSSYTYDVFIMVFRKGAAEQQFSTGPFEVANLRDPNWAPNTFAVPSVFYGAWSGGTYDPSSSPTIVNARPSIGGYGIGAISGTVFRQVADPATYQSAVPRPQIIAAPIIEPIIYSPPADGTANSASPLIYVYQTTLTF